MSDVPAHVRAVAATSIAVLTTAAGFNLGLSFFVVPRLLESPTPLMLRQWGNMYKVSSKSLRPAFMLPVLLNTYLAYKTPSKARIYSIAAVIAFSILPWTYAVIMPINRKIWKKVDEVQSLNLGPNDILEEEIGVKEEETGHALIDRWGLYNLYRGSAAFVSGCIGLYATLA
ncbi:hypothetical protein BX600DRAFT_452503 [Xylariales sp. PMI_506]|nr:hypothetical protein BX600DRAFT_452503 [Xylariales sp. PMI_506]